MTQASERRDRRREHPATSGEEGDRQRSTRTTGDNPHTRPARTEPARAAQQLLARYLWEHRWIYAAAVALIIGSNLLQTQIPRLLGRFTDLLKEGRLGPGDPWRFAVWLALLAAGYVGLGWTAQATVFRYARRFEYLLRNHLFTHWESLSAVYYTHHSVGDLMAHATNDVQALRMAIGGGITQVVNAAFLIVMVVAAMVGQVDPKLAAVSLLPLPLLTAIVVVMRPQIRTRFREVQEGFSRLTERVEENLAGIRVVKAYAQEDYETERFRAAAQNLVDRTLALTRVSALFDPLIQLIGAIAFLLSLGYGGIRVIEGDLSLGQLVAFNAYLLMLINPMQQIARVIDVTQRASSALGRLSELLAERPAVTDSPHPVPVRRLRGEIVFSHLTFAYPGATQPVLVDIDLTIHPGETVAILGRTGSGKSTLASLLLRVYDPPRGSLFLDGHDILDLPLAVLRREVAYVPQEPFLFSATIRENIALASDHFTMEQIETAARRAQLYENIQRFPQGFETEIGERGVTLSGGQRQRLALARALIKEAPILILDDSLSAVDTHTEDAILRELAGLRGRQTTLLIAHRISTVREADLIVVLEEGRIVQRGQHAQLVSQPGPYRAIYELQREGTAVGAGARRSAVGETRQGGEA